MTEVKSVRLPEDLLRTIRERAEREQLTESTTIRQLITWGSGSTLADSTRTGRSRSARQPRSRTSPCVR